MEKSGIFQSQALRGVANREAGKTPGSDVLSSHKVSRKLSALSIAALRESRTEEFSAPNVILHLSIKLYINGKSSII